jgi:hypothetical protein
MLITFVEHYASNNDTNSESLKHHAIKCIAQFSTYEEPNVA